MIKIANDKILKEPPTDEVIKLMKIGKRKDEVVSELSQKGFSSQQIADALNQAEIKRGVEGAFIPKPNQCEEEMRPSMLPPETGINEDSYDLPQNGRGGRSYSGLDSDNDEIPVPVPSPPPEDTEPVAQERSIPKIQKAPVQVLSPQFPSNRENIQEMVEYIIDERWQEIIAGVGDISLWKSKMEDDTAAIKQELLRLEERFNTLQASILGKVDEYQKSITQVSSEMVALEKVFSKIMAPLTSNIKELEKITKSIKSKG